MYAVLHCQHIPRNRGSAKHFMVAGPVYLLDGSGPDSVKSTTPIYDYTSINEWLEQGAFLPHLAVAVQLWYWTGIYPTGL